MVLYIVLYYTGACGYNQPCAHQYLGKYQSCMVENGRLYPHAPVYGPCFSCCHWNVNGTASHYCHRVDQGLLRGAGRTGGESRGGSCEGRPSPTRPIDSEQGQGRAQLQLDAEPVTLPDGCSRPCTNGVQEDACQVQRTLLALRADEIMRKWRGGA